MYDPVLTIRMPRKTFELLEDLCFKRRERKMSRIVRSILVEAVDQVAARELVDQGQKPQGDGQNGRERQGAN